MNDEMKQAHERSDYAHKQIQRTTRILREVDQALLLQLIEIGYIEKALLNGEHDLDRAEFAIPHQGRGTCYSLLKRSAPVFLKLFRELRAYGTPMEPLVEAIQTYYDIICFG